jgi:hypothetical protein
MVGPTVGFGGVCVWQECGVKAVGFVLALLAGIWLKSQ